MTEIPLKSVTAVLLGLAGGRILNPASDRPILIFPAQQSAELHLHIGVTFDWVVEGVLKFSTVVTDAQRWRQGEVFVRICESEPAS